MRRGRNVIAVEVPPRGGRRIGKGGLAVTRVEEVPHKCKQQRWLKGEPWSCGYLKGQTSV